MRATKTRRPDGRWLALMAAALATGCGPGLNPTPVEPTPDCANAGGAYRASFNTSCGQSATALPATVSLTGCSFTTTIQGLGRVTGTIVKGTADISVEFQPPCTGTANGTAMVGTGRIDAAFAGTQTGAGACCSVVSGTFSLSR